jgi:hypothetical protein
MSLVIGSVGEYCIQNVSRFARLPRGFTFLVRRRQERGRERLAVLKSIAPRSGTKAVPTRERRNESSNFELAELFPSFFQASFYQAVPGMHQTQIGGNGQNGKLVACLEKLGD